MSRDNPTFVRGKGLGDQTREAWFYDDKRGIDVLAESKEGYLTRVRISWRSIREAMDRNKVTE